VESDNSFIVREFTATELLGPLNQVEEKNAPRLLFVAGDPSLARRRPRVAIVGSRRASPDGRRRAARLSRLLVQYRVTVVSGLAEGIDTEAHRAAIAADGMTIAVLGTPLSACYPQQNRELQTTIMTKHLAVSQFPLGSAVQRRNFPLRNRTMALLSDASVIVEAGETSGALSQGWEALRLARPLFLMRSIVENSNLRWAAKMLDYGASVLSEPEELLESLPVAGSDDSVQIAL